MALPVEFLIDALEDLEDLPAVARQLTRAMEHGRIACGQPDETLRELVIGENRIVYRVEAEQLVVVSAEPCARILH